MNPLHCSACGSAQVSPMTTLALAHGTLNLQYQHNPQGGLFSKGNEYLGPPVGRACADCGHVMLFLNQGALAKLRQTLASLHPVDG